MTDRPHKIPCAEGFSLLETLVALTILTVSLSVILGIFSTALHAAAEADAITRATRVGESLLARLGSEIPLREGVSRGDLDAVYHWQITVSPFQPEAGLQTWQTPLHAYWVEVEVAWDSSRPRAAVKLSTLRLAADSRTPL